MGKKYLDNPITVGQKIRNKRLELHLLQKDVAELLGVCEDSITYWENNRAEPLVYHYPKIIQFLGYVPLTIDTTTLGGRMILYRHLKGISQETLARELGVNESTVFQYEKGKHMPSAKVLKKLGPILEEVESAMGQKFR